MKNTKILAVVLAMLIGVTGCSNAKDQQNNQPGTKEPNTPENVKEETLTGKGKGFGGTITVTVTKAGDKITKVDVKADDETQGIGTQAVEKLPAAIVEANGTDVEVISGATYTSHGIIDAVNNALDPEKYPFEEEAESERAEVALAENGLKTGFGAVISVADSKDNDVRSTSVSVGLTLDKDGKITVLQADAMPADIPVNTEGKLQIEGDQRFKSAKESADPEWTAAISAFEKESAGKTIEEVKSLSNEDGMRKQLIAAAEKAAESAMSLGAKQGDKMGLGVVNVLVNDQGSHSRDASAEREGQAQAYHSYAVVTTDDSGVITSCIIDASQANVNFDTTGKLTTDVSQPVLTKIELRDKYGMRARSSIKKEWFEQAWAIADYATGKTVDEVKGISVNEEGNINEPDLVSSATIGLEELTHAVENAANNAK